MAADPDVIESWRRVIEADAWVCADQILIAAPASVIRLDNTWTDTGKAMFNNWLGLVYQLTGVDRRTPLMPGLDPDNPLGLEIA